MERKLEEKEKHIQYLYLELEEKEKDIENLKNSLKKSKNVYQRQTDFAREAIEEKESMSIKLKNKEEEIADLKMRKCEKGCQKYNKSIDEIVEAAAKHKEKLEALIEIAGSQKEKIFCLRNHRNELFEKIDKLNDEHDNELKHRDETVAILQEEKSNLNLMLSDDEEEIRILKVKIEQLQTFSLSQPEVISIENELRQANDNLEKEELLKELKHLQHQVKGLQKNKNERMTLLKHLEDLSTSRIDELEKLKKTVRQTTMENTRCRYGWKCRRPFCNFDHSYLYTKINKNERGVKHDEVCKTCRKGFISEEELKKHLQNIHENVVGTVEKNYPCGECTRVFKSSLSLRRHIKKEHSKEKASTNEFVSKVDEASPDVELRTGEHFTCLFCDMHFKCEREVQIHIDGNHSEKKIGGNSICENLALFQGGY